MSIIEMLGQSALLTALGMSVVFSFIIIMIICMKILHLIVHVLKLDKEPKVETKNNTTPAAKDDGAVIAAIAAAVHNKQLNS